MLNQLIYTRCMPHRELKNKGQVVRADGFGVFSLSQGMINNPPVSNFDFLQTRLAVQNGAKETSAVGLFNSYEYVALGADVYAFSFEVARPHCKEPRKNGQGHRTGTYIKQCFVGVTKDYPFMWFGASAWNAHLKSENDYYLDEDPNAVPELLQPIKDIPNGGYITIDKVKAFVNDGRVEAVKAGIWFLLQEYAKPEYERKVLLIKDIPENVELWIAAMEYAFSPEMARTITFSTNKTKLGTQTDSILFYYTDESGKFYPMLNRSISQVRHPYNMIVGYHPKDTFCASVKQMPTSNFVMIDGTTKTASFSPDESVRTAYYSAVVRYDADIMDFCSIVLPSLPLTSINDKIPELYDAYKYILDSNHKVEKWNYKDAINALCTFTQFGLPNNDALNMYILDEGLRRYQKFADEDEKNNFALLKVMWDISIVIKRNREVTGCIADRLSVGMMNLKGAGSALSATWNAVKMAKVQSIVWPALKDLFNDADLGSYSIQFDVASADSICTIMEMYFEALSRERNGMNSILENNEKYQFVCMSLISLIDHENALRSVLNGINGSSDLVNAVALSVSQCLEKHNPSKTAVWWDAIIELSGGNVIELCRTLCRSDKTNIDMVERLLANSILRTNKCDRHCIGAFNDSMKMLGKEKDTGLVFYRAWIKVADLSQADSIIREIRGNSLNVSTEKTLFKELDHCIPYDVSTGFSSMGVRSMKEWANELGEISICVAFYELKRDLEHERKTEKAVRILNEFGGLKIALPNNFTTTKYFADIAQKAAYFNDGEVHMAFISMFVIPDEREQVHFVNAYVREVLDNTKGKQHIYSLISLYGAFFLEYKIPNKKPAQIKALAQILENCFQKALPDYYKSSLVDQVSKVSNCDRDVKMGLISMLKDTGQKAASKGGLGSLLGNIFGKR